MKTAIVGLPMVGKTSLFTILTGVHEATRVGLMEARVGVSKVPDPRLEALAAIFSPPKVTYATVEYLDFPAVSKGILHERRMFHMLFGTQDRAEGMSAFVEKREAQWQGR